METEYALPALEMGSLVGWQTELLNKAFCQGAAMDTLDMVWGKSLVDTLFPY